MGSNPTLAFTRTKLSQINFSFEDKLLLHEIWNRIRFDKKTKDAFIESLSIGITNYINKGIG